MMDDFTTVTWLPRYNLDRQNETFTLDLSECRFHLSSHRYRTGHYRWDCWLGLVLIRLNLNLSGLQGHGGRIAACAFMLLVLASRVLPWPDMPDMVESPGGTSALVQGDSEPMDLSRVVPWQSAQPPGFTEAVTASFYGPGCRGRMANGEFYDKNRMLAASMTLPLGSWAMVCRQDLCASVQIVDRGPFPDYDDPRRGSRAIDLGEGPAAVLGMKKTGLATVTIHPLPAITISPER